VSAVKDGTSAVKDGTSAVRDGTSAVGRPKVQSAVDRRFDRTRYDGERTIAAFTGRLRDQIDLGGLQADLATTVGAALHPTSTGVWVRLAKGDEAQ